MKAIGNSFLSLSAPLLIVLAILGLLQRQGTTRLQSVPAIVVGSGLIVSGAIGRFRRRRRLLMALMITDKGID